MKRVIVLVLGLIILVSVGVYLYFGSFSAARCFLHTESFERIICLKPYFEGITESKSAEYALARADTWQRQGLIGDCHLPAHYIGEANLHKHQDELGTALATCSELCIQGCVHGVMESFISHHTEASSLKNEIDNICEVTKTDSLLYRQCVHGVGHGVLAHGYVPMPEAIELCYAFSGTFEQETCLGGLFMENVDRYLLDDETSLSKAIPQMCAEVASEDLLDDCYGAIGEGMMFYTGHDLEKSRQLCELIDEKYIDVCQEMAQVEGELNASERAE